MARHHVAQRVTVTTMAEFKAEYEKGNEPHITIIPKDSVFAAGWGEGLFIFAEGEG